MYSYDLLMQAESQLLKGTAYHVATCIVKDTVTFTESENVLYKNRFMSDVFPTPTLPNIINFREVMLLSE